MPVYSWRRSKHKYSVCISIRVYIYIYILYIVYIYIIYIVYIYYYIILYYIILYYIILYYVILCYIILYIFTIIYSPGFLTHNLWPQPPSFAHNFVFHHGTGTAWQFCPKSKTFKNWSNLYVWLCPKMKLYLNLMPSYAIKPWGKSHWMFWGIISLDKPILL